MSDDEAARLDPCRRANEFWAEYKRTHDLAAHNRCSVGVDPDAGEVVFAKTVGEMRQLNAAAHLCLIWFVPDDKPFGYWARNGPRRVRLRRLDRKPPTG